MLKQVNSRSLAEEVPEVPEQWFNQTLTHDGGKDSKIYWQQRYFVNDQYYKPGGPVFLFIGGEGELEGLWTQYSLLTISAKKYHGIVYALEHRFYGKSYPKPDLSVDNLKYLSADLAIKDLVYFAKNIKLPQSNSTRCQKEKAKWIITGGSYPGNLAAWARLKYQDIFFGAIASSAPVEVRENYYEYDQIVQKSLAKNGGKECLIYHIENFNIINEVLLKGSSQEKQALKDKFSCSKVSDENFGIPLLFNLSIMIQYNNNKIPGNVGDYCKALKLNGTRIEKLDDFAKAFKKSLGNKTCELYTDVTSLKDTKKPLPQSFFRQWIYQSCFEFGYWWTAPPEGQDSVRSRLLTVPFFRKFACKDVLGDKGPQIPKPDQYNQKYHGKNINVDRLMFVNGDLDPWMPLSVINSTNKLMPSIMIKGASHGTDLTIPLPTDSKEVIEAKEKVLEFVDSLLVK
ncbi:peptidase S28 [Neoconidiobolus thromboides FSU 785]|nr:peptidase S28 [Neoconidiobolus thromboides FSU 785]